jgi:hypothetical protein
MSVPACYFIYFLLMVHIWQPQQKKQQCLNNSSSSVEGIEEIERAGLE